MVLLTTRELIQIRDNQPMKLSKKQTKQAMNKFGYVDLRNIFKIMGYTHAFNDKWKKE